MATANNTNTMNKELENLKWTRRKAWYYILYNIVIEEFIRMKFENEEGNAT